MKITVKSRFKVGKIRPCIMTGLGSDTSIDISADPHNWCRKIPVSAYYAEMKLAGKTAKWKDLEKKAYHIFYSAELFKKNEDEWQEALEPLEEIWSIVRPEVEFFAAKLQASKEEDKEKAALDNQAALLASLDDIELE